MDTQLPDFHIPHREKIEWMVETSGFAVEPVAPQSEGPVPLPGYAYTIGFPARFAFPEVVVFGLTPVAANGLIGLVADALAGGTEIPLGVELAGLFDNDLRCVFAPIHLDEWGRMFQTAAAWYKGAPYDVVQLLWPDKQGWLPYEPGFDRRLVMAQPVIGDVLDA